MSSSVQQTLGPQSPSDPAQPGFRPLSPLPAEWLSLANAFVGQVRKHWSEEAICDGTGVSLTYGNILLRALVLGRHLSRTVADDVYVGVLLPPTVPAAVVNLRWCYKGRSRSI